MSEFPTFYQDFIYKTRYSRFLWKENRREFFEESIQRYINEIINQCTVHNYELKKNELERIYNSIYNLQCMPSMRLFMTAGSAVQRDNSASYNCAGIAIDSPRAFDELLYLLSCGCGVGLSVEHKFITQLPKIAEKLYACDTVIHVKDSRIGWAESFKQLISLLYSGSIPKWDTSKVRPSGTPLKKFGGRASGPLPLEQLFQFTVNLFKGAEGRKLTSVECTDLACKVAEAIIAGSVRRSALIVLCDLNDDKMRYAKTGNWLNTAPQRQRANISAVYNGKPDMNIFMDEWKSLYESKSGERGIFNRQAAIKKAEETGRDIDDFILNPCQPSFATVLTPEGIKFFSDIDIGSTIWSGKHWTKVANKWKTGIKPVYKYKTQYSEFIGTDTHYIMSSGNKKQIDDAEFIDSSKDTINYYPTKIINKKYLGEYEVFDINVEAEEHTYWTGGCLVSNCGETILRPSGGFCNLSEIIAKPEDTEQALLYKAETAAIIGTIQSSYTNFRYLRKKWIDNAEEERLLGVSISGIWDNPILRKQNKYTIEVLNKLYNKIKEVNKEWSKKLNINPSKARSLIKPSGSVSNLCNCSPGIHPRLFKYSVKNVRNDMKDPVSQFMIDQGIPYEQDMGSNDTYIFKFPLKVPEKGICSENISAEDQFNIAMFYRQHYCDHNVSATVQLQEDDWLKMADLVYKNFDEISGISFFPAFNATQPQLPFQKIDKIEYDNLIEKMPENVDWHKLKEYEKSEDYTEHKMECSGGACHLT